MSKAAILLVLLFGSVISGPLEKAHKVNKEKRILSIVECLLDGRLVVFNTCWTGTPSDTRNYMSIMAID